MAIDAVQLRSDNYDSWANFPGEHDLRINRDYYLYNCTNSDAIYFAGAKPECTEIGPLKVYENSTYINTDFQSLPIPEDLSSKKVSTALLPLSNCGYRKQ